MRDYRPPLRDIHFVLDEIVGLDTLRELDGFAHVESDLLEGVLGEFGRFAAEVVAPLNRDGDTVGAAIGDDGVTTAPGFAAAYSAFVDAGWPAVPFDVDYGGGGFPWVIGIAIQEMLTSASMGFSLCPLLTQGAIELVGHHGSEEQKELYLRRMITGEWSGTMNLTEPDAGSDVGALRTRAVPAGDGTYRIFGQKIFITYGDHDMTENIVHLVLARTPDAPPGTKGISCFIVPKFLVDADGSLGDRNDAHAVSIEHKLGIHASPTCVMAFGDGGDGAVGYLIGEENRGMAYMFTMMNNARLSVGLQGLSIAERAYQQAIDYAKERRQGRAVGAAAGESSPIIEHADVRRMLLWMRSHIEAMRGLVYMNAAAVDVAAHHPDPAVAQAAEQRAALLTPLTKAWCTDVGVELASVGLQIHGGMGYVEETGAAQHLRDARIAPIYEGTNGIQAIDLVTRKLSLDGGRVHKDLLNEIGASIETGRTIGGRVAVIADRLAVSLAHAEEAATAIEAHDDPNDRLTGATPYCELLSIVAGGWVHLLGAIAADRRGGNDAFDEAKVVTAQFFAEQVLPKTAALVGAATATSDVVFALSAEQLTT